MNLTGKKGNREKRGNNIFYTRRAAASSEEGINIYPVLW